MRRREFLGVLGGAAAAWPVAARAQQAMPVVGFLNGQSAAAFAHLVAAFHRGLNEAEFVERQNVAVEYRWAEGQSDRLPAMAAELIGRRVNVIVAVGGAHVIAMSATKTIPVICTFGGDPTKDGFVASLNRPGGNVTGASVFSAELEAKRFELLHQLVPGDALVGTLIDPGFSDADTQRRQVEAAAGILRRRIRVFEVRNEHEIDSAFESLRVSRAGAVAVTANPFLNSRRAQVVALAARHAIPALYEYREAPLAGGLMSYGPSIPEIYRQIGSYAGRVLKGEKPADLPVVQPAKFDFVINLQAAKALGLEIPPTLLARADEVIE